MKVILRILFLSCVIFASPSLGKLSLEQFTREYEHMCFRGFPEYIYRMNGQYKSRSNTLENFIAMAENMERVNPSNDLKKELECLLSKFFFENIQFINGTACQWSIASANFNHIDSMWSPGVYNRRRYRFSLSNADRCSFFYMISHSILKNNTIYDRPENYRSRDNRNEKLNPDDYFPQEMGVIAIRGTDEAVSLSKVLIGLYVGLKPDRMSDITSYENVKNLKIPTEQLPQDKVVDALFATTLVDVLMRATWTGSDRPGLAPNGKWTSFPIDAEKNIDGFCPMIYLQHTQNGSLPASSYSSVRGAADGLILGLAVRDLYIKKPDIKLSQILRMYYSPDGITLDSLIDEINSKHISFCNRQNIVKILEPKLLNQMKLYGYLVAQSLENVDQGYEKAKSLYQVEKNTIFQSTNSELMDFCSTPPTLHKPDNLSRETNLDVLIVMDSRYSKDSFLEQQMISGYLAKYLDLRYTGSRMTILLDRKWNYRSYDYKLDHVVLDTFSSSSAACYVGQIEYETSYVWRDHVIKGIDEFLQERKEKENELYGIKGKVVVYFNYEIDNEGSSDNDLQNALRDLYSSHRDIVFYAAGLNPELLKTYVKNDPSFVILVTNGTHEDIAKRIYRKISFAPTLLLCPERTDEKIIHYESMVSPNSTQYYGMPARYFYKSSNISFKFESQIGHIKVCHSRGRAKPENEIKNCKNTTGKNAVEFHISNPCNGFSKETCAPFYFSVMGMYSKEGKITNATSSRNYCDDLEGKWCTTLDQVRFKISHTGIC